MTARLNKVIDPGYRTIMSDGEFAKAEQIIEQGQHTFLEVGRALVAIREGHGYRHAGYATFEDYCRRRWGWTRQHGYELIWATEAAEDCKNVLTSEPTFSQALQLARVPSDARADIAQELGDLRQYSTRDLQGEIEKRQPDKQPRPMPGPGSRTADTRPLLRFCPPDMTAAQIVAAILRTSFPDALTALDVTYGFGAFWDGSAHVHVTGVDSDPSRGVDGVTDFRDLPFDDNSFDVVTFDPPHIADGGADGIMAMRYGTYVADDLEDAVRRGSTEAWRVARLGVVVKVTDAVHTSRYVAMSDWVREMISGPIYDVVYETRTHALVDPKWRDQLSARNNGATYLIFRTDGPVHVRRTVEATHAAD